MHDCAMHGLTDLHMDKDDIQSCIDASFDNKDPALCTKNKYFEREEKAMETDGVFLFPSVIINGFTYRVISFFELLVLIK